MTTLAPFTVVGQRFAPDGRLFIWQKNGVVRVIKQGVLLPTPFIDLSSKVNTFDDRGMWGLAFHPDFTSNGYVYMSYPLESGGNPNDSGPKTSRVVRVRADPANPDVALAGSETVILGSIGTAPCSAQPPGADCIAADSGSHALGTLRFATDGMLFIGNGDGADAAFADPLALRAQDLNSYNGKILRVRDDGTAPGDNPFDDGTNSIRSKVWLYGVRNPFDYTLNPTTGQPYFGDVGWNVWEEVDAGVRGGNYGWPCFEGNLPQPAFQSAFSLCQQLPAASIVLPIHTYDHSVGTAVIGGPFYTGSLYPAQYRGNYFFADYSGNFIKRITFDASGNPTGTVSFATGVDSPVSLELGPDGMIYYLSFATGQLRRIQFNGPVTVASATPTSGYSPLTVAFSSAGSIDPGGQALSFLWDFGDGTTSTAANPSHTYASATVRTFTARLTSTDSGGLSSSMTTSITVGSLPPSATISAPADGTQVDIGQTVNFSGSATDPDDGTVAPAGLSWTVLLHHNSHVHTVVTGTGPGGSFVVEDHGVIGTFSYEVVLQATDSSGLTSTTSVHLPITPAAADTTPPGAPASLTATASSATQVDLAWPAATDNVAVTGYRLERCTGAGCTTFAEIATPTGLTASDPGRTASTTYRYQVRASDAAGNLGAYSPIASVTTPAVQPPPTGLVAAYAFDETAGTTAGDASGNANTGTLQTGAGWTAAGHAGGALVLRRLERPGPGAGLELARADQRDDPRGLDPAVGRPGRLADHPAARDRRLLPQREQRHRCPASVGRRHVRGHDRLRDRHDAQSGRGLDPCRR